MPTTYEPIATTILGSAASSITFSSIPNTYTDLKIIIVTSEAAGFNTFSMIFNGVSTGTPYSLTRLYGNGATAFSSAATSSNYMEIGIAGASGKPSMTSIDIFSYAGSAYKTALSIGNGDQNGSGRIQAYIGLWRNTSTINSVSLTTVNDGGTFDAGTTATLYGIKAA